MIDWLTLHIGAENLPQDTIERLSKISDKIMRITPEGEIAWSTSTFQSLRSDTNGLSFSFTGLKLTIAGSPSSVVNPNNVFGSDDPLNCFISMLNFFTKHTGIFLPYTASLYRATRIDYTENVYVINQDNVKLALETLKNTKTRGDNVERKHTTIYWNKSSALRSGKVYNKYLHAKKCIKAHTHYYTDEQLSLTKSLLRFELKLGRIWFHHLEKHWSELTVEDLKKEHQTFFKNILGSIEVTNMNQLLNQLEKIAPTKSQALAAFRTYQLVCSLGQEKTKLSMPKTTWYRHRKMLLDAGLCKSDLELGEIVQFRRTKVIEMTPVNSWAELKLASGA